MPTTSSRKKVLVRDLHGNLQAGYLPLQKFVNADFRTNSTTVELLDLEGRVVPVPLAEQKWIAWVSDWNLSDREDPERLTRRIFLARPRAEGLWVRVCFSAGDSIEGLAAPDLSLLDGMGEDRGLFLMPPDLRANTQRLFIPRSAMKSLELLAVITSPSRKQRAVQAAQPASGRLFPES